MSETIALEALVEVLVEQGLIDALSPEQLEELVEDTFNGDVEELEDWAAAAILQTVYAERSGAERGVVHHDHRFGSETSDVVAELSATLGGEPVAFKQIGVRDDALHIQIGEKDWWVTFAPGGLDAIAHWMNFRLGEAGARRRIFSVQTDGDSHCYVVAAPEDVASMKKRGVRGFGVP